MGAIMRKNVCRKHGVGGDYVKQLTRITDLLKYWVKVAHHEVVDECDHVVLFRDNRTCDDSDADVGQDLVLLAIDARKSPAVQYFAPLVRVDASASSSAPPQKKK